MFALTVLARLRAMQVLDLRKLSRSLSIQATTTLSRQTEMPAKIFGENKLNKFYNIQISRVSRNYR